MQIPSLLMLFSYCMFVSIRFSSCGLNLTPFHYKNFVMCSDKKDKKNPSEVQILKKLKPKGLSRFRGEDKKQHYKRKKEKIAVIITICTL